MYMYVCRWHYNFRPPPKESHILIPWTCGYVTLCDKRDFACVIKLRILSWEMILDDLGGPSVITRILRSEGQAGESEKEMWGKQRVSQWEKDWPLLAFGMEGGHEPRSVSSFQKLKESRQWILPRTSRKECRPTNTLILTLWVAPLWTSDFQNCKMTNLCCFMQLMLW